MIKELEQLLDIRLARLSREKEILQKTREKRLLAEKEVESLTRSCTDLKVRISEMSLDFSIGKRLSAEDIDGFFFIRGRMKEQMESIKKSIDDKKSMISELARLVDLQTGIVNKARVKSEAIEKQLAQQKALLKKSKINREERLAEDSFR